MIAMIELCEHLDMFQARVGEQLPDLNVHVVVQPRAILPVGIDLAVWPVNLKQERGHRLPAAKKCT